MSESTCTKSIQFWVEPDGILQFAELLEKSALTNCILGTDDDAIVIEVDYDPSDESNAQHIAALQQSDVIEHHEEID